MTEMTILAEHHEAWKTFIGRNDDFFGIKLELCGANVVIAAITSSLRR